MASVAEKTWLPLDRWAEILGISPLPFNQLHSDTYSPQDCADVWYQYAYQRSDQISRTDLAMAIQDAERMIASHVGYFLIPDWVSDERIRTVRPAKPELYPTSSFNVRGQAKSITTRWKQVVSGGRRAKTLIQAGRPVVRTDSDGDGYDETATVTVTTTVTEPCEIRAYYPGVSGSDDWEIRPINVSIASGTATITFKSWQIVDPDLLTALNADDVDANEPTNYVTTIDVYRVYNDPQSQGILLWENQPCDYCLGTGCEECVYSTQNACLLVRNKRLGHITYKAGDWDADEERFDYVALAVGRDPDLVRVWYYSGWEAEDSQQNCPRVKMDPYWEKAVTYLAAALLDRPICACNNAQEFVEHWRTDLSRVGADVSFQVSPKTLDNPFGTTRGAVYAWQRVSAEGRIVQR